MEQYFLFLDESGTASLKNIDPYFPALVLTGTLVSETSYKTIEDRINRLKQKYFPGKQVVLHRRDMRKYERGFEIFFDDNVKRKFYNDLNKILSESDYELITSAIDKNKYLEQFGKLTSDPYQIALSFILERCVLKAEEKGATIQAFIESRGKKEDKLVDAQYNTLLHRGSHEVAAERFLNRFDPDLVPCKKQDMVIGIEVADLCAYPIGRFVLNNNEPNPAFDIIRPKMASNNTGNVIGFGIKLYP